MISGSFKPLGNTPPINKFAEVLEPRFKEVGRAIGRELANRTAYIVRVKIPSGGGWLAIYRDAIRYRESKDGTQWAIHGWARMELSTPPAETTLVTIEGPTSDPVIGLMMAQNPWTVDLIPPIAGGYNATARADPASTAVVSSRRAALLAIRKTTHDSLNNLGARVFPYGFTASFKNGVFADLAFLARSLELGANGLPQQRHWSTAAEKLRGQGERWAERAAGQVDQALMGQQLPSTNQMTPAQADELAKMRENDWS